MISPPLRTPILRNSISHLPTRAHRRALASSYHELLEEFSSKDLRTVGNYSLGRLIGKGSFGKVYLATHKLTNGSKVVLKSAKKDDSNLAREIHHHRQFLHPHIARLYEVIITENLVWLVLEYCPGDELYNYLLKNGPLPVDKVQKTFTQLVGAVSYVHNCSCVHRDLKLENILLDKNENVKLVDFGFTREYEGKASYLQTFCGTVCYSAPEMLKGEKYAGEKVDVWSLGVILYALLTGELPFDDDDDNVTRTKILSDDPKWPDHLTTDARSLLSILLSKRPLIRPALSDILTHPFLSEHAPQQQAILKLQQPAPFTTPLEKETLERMRSAGVDIDKVIEHVLARRCDTLAGWWALLIEKEERKQARRERKRKEKEAENRASRRLSAASSRLERMAPTLRGVDEEGHEISIGDPPRSRGRKDRRSAHYPDLVLTDLPGLPENALLNSPEIATPPLPIEKDSIRSASSSRHRRPVPPPKEGVLRSARSRGSTLQLVTTNPDLITQHANGVVQPPARRKHQHAFINQLAHWKHWLLDSAKRARSPGKKASRSTPDLLQKSSNSSRIGPKEPSPRPTTSKTPTPVRPQLQQGPKSHPALDRIYTTPNKRQSLSPAPLTPRSTYRRSSTGLRGRKSTSSSVSSIRSIHHHHHTHSKASSTSSNGSAVTSKVSLPTRSPHHSVKVLPATPTAGAFPSNIRVVRQAPISSFNEGAWPPGFGSNSTGLVFAKRKKNLFKGPLLNTSSPNSSGNPGGSSIRTGSHSRSTSVAGRRSGEITGIEEEDEDEVEEVEAFSPITGPGVIEETIFAPGETPQ
ncbi:serine threonine-kinase [Hyphodiscus hymeniophilus]|uniref:Serine threonine-kinase n=1 Tax=Hyphodiscus hymeniophilus TaxID=353542 RepID=A0A9P7AZ21_9HELO|nr:serine threonine-kinase [Hyphodiscus hymeniophilus]